MALATQPIITEGIELGYKAHGAQGDYTVVQDITSAPALGGAPEKIDVTTLANTAYVYIQGLQNYEDLEFGLIYVQAHYKALYDAVKADAVTGLVPVLDWKLSFKDGTYFTFEGQGSVAVAGAEVNNAITATLTITPSSEITPNFPS